MLLLRQENHGLDAKQTAALDTVAPAAPQTSRRCLRTSAGLYVTNWGTEASEELLEVQEKHGDRICWNLELDLLQCDVTN